jgi:hypothetical protein
MTAQQIYFSSGRSSRKESCLNQQHSADSPKLLASVLTHDYVHIDPSSGRGKVTEAQFSDHVAEEVESSTEHRFVRRRQ